MMMYDPTTFGTPLPMLQIPPPAIQSIQAKLQSAGCIITRYTQDCKVLADLQPAVPAPDFAVMRESMVDVGFICRKCQMVFPGKEACMGHQQMFCYQGKNVHEQKAIIKLDQIQYECSVCRLKMATLAEVTTHIQGEAHRQNMSLTATAAASSGGYEEDSEATSLSKIPGEFSS